MEVLMSGNENVIATLYLMQLDAGIDFSATSRERFQELAAEIHANFLSADKNFKPSVFNYRVEMPKQILVYNTLYNALAKLTKSEFEKLNGKKSCGRALHKKFLEMGFAVGAEVDERKNYALWREKMNRDFEHLSVNITTTLKCNARCTYCYEQGVKFVDFDENFFDALINFIKAHKKDQPVKLNWFGGEPLMNPKLIDAVTKKVGELGFEYVSAIITNGSLITKQMIKNKFPAWNLQNMQITLDGTEKTYLARKNYLGKPRGMFKKILDNIEAVAAANYHVDIRLNADSGNLNDILDLIYILQARFDGNKNICYYPAFVTQINDQLSEREKIDFVKEIFRALANPNKLSITSRLFSAPRNMPCMRCDPQSFSVDVFGRIYNCEHLVGRKEKSIGTLKRLSEKVNADRVNYNLREECRTCIFLPKCMGGCESNLATNDEACMIEKYLIQAYMEYLCE